ncbi:multidrug effflux MFS transporter [Acinetobacter rudis]|uniref:multidrug effflux MFS transporter n=1 Tax=Acinetobacter rudis TaxID=632955 RepID=UPI00280EB124|nr:multidrug effflux MFS transporter [Acinetobacter rudis]MDQ8954289.1 multidrug effflux MFS transporter [Acinetobacter rudis]
MKSQTSHIKLAASLALITVLGPLAIDMYLSSLPEIAIELGSSFANVQLTLTVFLLSMGLGQLIFGPITDAYGRKRPLMAGLVVFILMSLWAASADSIQTLLYARFGQGLSASLILVVALSTVRDVSEGAQAAQLFALLMTIEGLAPVLAPAVGGVIDGQWGWRAVFVAMALMGVFALLNSQLNLKESLAAEDRIALNSKNVLGAYKNIICTRSFILPAFSLSAAFFFLFAYIAGASLVYQKTFLLSTEQFGFTFGATGTAVLLGAFLCNRLIGVLGIVKLSVYGAILMGLGAVCAAVMNTFAFGVYAIAASFFISMMGLGIAESTFMALAMSSQKTALGSTAAVLGAMQLMIASFATPLAGYISELGAMHWLLLLCIIGIILIALTLFTVARLPNTADMAVEH